MVSLISYVVGGLALFMYGMKLAADGLRDAAGGRLRATLTLLTSRRTTAVLSGVVVTFLVSSSSAVAVMLVELANGDLISLSQAVLVLLGAGIGIALTVQVITFNVSSWALFLVALGLLMHLLANFRRGKALGAALMGVGLVFFGLFLINDGVAAKAKEAVESLSGWLEHPLLGFLLGVAVSALLRSAATVGIAVVLAGNNVTLPHLVPVVLGATVGTCAAPLIAAIKGGRKGRQVAVAELAFRLVVAGAFLFLILPTAQLMSWVTRHLGIEATDEDLRRRAVANTMLFVSVATTVVVVPFTAALVKVVERLVGRPPRFIGGGALQHIGFEGSRTAEEALEQAHREVVRMAEMTRGLLGRSVKAVVANDEREMERLEAADENVDVIDKVLSQYLQRLKPGDLAPEALEVKSKLLYIIKDLEEMADLATRELARIGWEKSRDNVEFVDGQKEEIAGILRFVDEDLERLVVAVRGEDRSEVVRAKVIERDRDIDLQRMRLFDRQFARIAAGAPGAEESSEPYMNTVNILRMVHFLITDILRMMSEPPPQRKRPGSADGEFDPQ